MRVGGRAVRGSALAAGLLCAGIAAAPAPAATVSGEGFVRYTAVGGEVNKPTFSVENGRLTVVDPTAVLEAVAPCEPDGEHRVSCPGAPNGMIVELGDGDDVAALNVPGAGEATSFRLTGGLGNDELTAERPAELHGDDGDDRLTGQDEEMLPGQCPAGMVCAVPPDPCRSTAFRNDEIFGGPGNDTINGRGGADVVVGGEGDDVIDGGGGCDSLAADSGSRRSLEANDATAAAESNEGPGGNDMVFGGPGDDTLAGGAGNDALDGSSGSDSIDPGLGDDIVFGGVNDSRSYDRVKYSWRTAPLTISLDGLPNDGEPGERDQLLGIESANGGSGPDVLIGDSRSTPNAVSGGYGGGNNLVGGAGDDTIVGGGGFHDVLEGGDGSDRIHALDGPPEGNGAVVDIPGMNTYAWDDRVECDRWGVPTDPAAPGAADMVLVDPGDNSLKGSVRGCETVLNAETPVTLRGGDTVVPVAAVCPVQPVTANCLGDIEIRLADAPAVPIAPAARKRKPRIPLIDKGSRRLAKAQFKARTRRARTVRVSLPAKSRAFLRSKGSVRAYVVFRYKQKR